MRRRPVILAASLVLAGCSATTTAGQRPPQTTAETSTTLALTSPLTSTSSPAAGGEVASFAGVSFRLPADWSLVAEQPGKSCAQPTTPPAGAPSWLGCVGVWVETWTTDPMEPGNGPARGVGSVWFWSSGTLPCPYPNPQPNDLVLGPGSLTAHMGRDEGSVSYQWYQWAANCTLVEAPGSPTTNTFAPQVWWLSSSGVAFVDATGHAQTAGILASVQ